MTTPIGAHVSTNLSSALTVTRHSKRTPAAPGRERGDRWGETGRELSLLPRGSFYSPFPSLHQASLPSLPHLHPRNCCQWTQLESLSLIRPTVRVGVKPQGPALVSGFFLATQFGIHKSLLYEKMKVINCSSFPPLEHFIIS